MSNQNSTIVRIISKSARVFPAVFEPVLAEMFLRAPARYQPKLDEAATLAKAQKSWVETDSGRARVYAWGEGPRVLLVHGHGGAAAQMTPFVAPLLSMGLGVVAFDAPGHGRAEGKRSALPLFARALSKVMTAIGPLEGVITHSLGGAALLLAAVEDGVCVKKAVLIAPPSDVIPWFTRFATYVDLTPELSERVRRRIEARVGIAMDKLKVSAMPAALRAPMLVIHDRDDKEVPHASGQDVARYAEDAQLITTAGLGHRRIVRDALVIKHAVEHVAKGAPPLFSLERAVNLELFDRERLQDRHALAAW